MVFGYTPSGCPCANAGNGGTVTVTGSGAFGICAFSTGGGSWLLVSDCGWSYSPSSGFGLSMSIIFLDATTIQLTVTTALGVSITNVSASCDGTGNHPVFSTVVNISFCTYTITSI